MPSSSDIEARFWDALAEDGTMMLGLDGLEDGHVRPMTARFEEERGPIWFFTSTNNGVVEKLGQGQRAIASFVSKKHEVLATLHGTLSRDNDRATIDRLWNSYVAAWYEGGKHDPTLVLLRLEAERAQIWLDGSGVLGAIKVVLGLDPKKEFHDNVAKVTFT
jgi:general stress protein 26